MPPDAPEFIADDLLEWTDDGLRLVASWDTQDGRTIFPPRLRDERFERTLLPTHGRLWSWTVQRFRPKSPPYAGRDMFEPYAVGYIELDGALIVEARLVDVGFDDLAIGMAMRLVPFVFELVGGETRTSFAFQPVAGASR